MRSGSSERLAGNADSMILASLTQTLTDWVVAHGLYAIFLVMAVDALLPAGGELTMLVAGALAAGALASQDVTLAGHSLPAGAVSYIAVSLAGTLGYLFGSLVGWAVGRFGGRQFLERHGRWLHLGEERLDRAERWFAHHGRAAVFLGRLTPIVRSFISVPAGAMDYPLALYTVLTLAASAIWCFGFAAGGWALGSRYDEVHHAFTALEVLAIAAAAVVGAAAAFLARRRRASRT
jgi:membrane protein DedA with SNARE-associated domain